MFYTKNKISATIASIIVAALGLFGFLYTYFSGFFTNGIGIAGAKTALSDYAFLIILAIVYIVYGLVMLNKIPFYWIWVAIFVPYFLLMVIAVLQAG